MASRHGGAEKRWRMPRRLPSPSSPTFPMKTMFLAGWRCREEQGQHVAQFVNVDVFQAQGGKFLAQPLASGGLAERRRRDLRELALPAPKLHFLIVQINERGVDAAHLGNAGDLPLRREP